MSGRSGSWFGRIAVRGGCSAAAALLMVASSLVAVAGASPAPAGGPDRVYVINRESDVGRLDDSVSVVDPATNAVVATVGVRTGPTDLAVSPDGSRAYVTTQGDRTGIGSVLVIDTATNALVAGVSGLGPYVIGRLSAVAVSPDGTQLYVTNPGRNAVLVIDTATNSLVATVEAAAFPSDVVVSPDGTRVYVLGSALQAIDTATNTVVATMPLQGFPGTVAVSPDGARIYVSERGRPGVSFVDAATFAVTSIVTTSPLTGMAVSPDGARLFVSTETDLVVIDTVTAAVVASMAVHAPRGFALSPDGSRIYVPRGGSFTLKGSLVTIDAATGAELATVTVGHSPVAVAVPPAPATPPTCAPVGAEPPGPFVNRLDADTSTVDGSAGQWVPWFSTNVSQSPAPRQGCSRSLKVDVIAPYGWGVTLRNFPGFAASRGAHVIGFWGRSANPGLAATMTVTWRDANRAVLGKSTVTLSLTGTFSHASAVAFAPPGTAFANVDLSGSSGNPGDTIFLDDISVTPVPSALDADTATLEGSKGQWVPWFSTRVSQSALQAHGGARSLKVDVTAPHGWGVQLKNFPGFATTPGPHLIGFWGRSATPGLAATMKVTWRDATRAVLGTDAVTLPLPDTWARASTLAHAPSGTAFASVDVTSPSGRAGDTIFLDDISVIAVPSVLDADTATMEGSQGQWVPWFSTGVSRSTAQARAGAHSLKVDVTAPYGWGVQLRNFPGFAVGPGRKTIGFWGRSPSAGMAATMSVRWRDASGRPLATHQLPLVLGDSWARAQADVTAPAGTARVTIELTNPAGVPGDTVYIDDVVVVDATIAALAP